jgi:3-hydroxyacyl-CoA dehydrogenase
MRTRRDGVGAIRDRGDSRVLELKHRLYASLAGLMADDAILASNTSGFPPDQLAASLRAKERFLIAHFWNPPHMIPLVEVCRVPRPRRK